MRHVVTRLLIAALTSTGLVVAAPWAPSPVVLAQSPSPTPSPTPFPWPTLPPPAEEPPLEPLQPIGPADARTVRHGVMVELWLSPAVVAPGEWAQALVRVTNARDDAVWTPGGQCWLTTTVGVDLSRLYPQTSDLTGNAAAFLRRVIRDRDLRSTTFQQWTPQMSSRSVSVRLAAAVLGLAAASLGAPSVASAGTLDTVYNRDLSTSGDIDGWGGGAVRWESLLGDSVQRFRKAPYLVVAVGSAVTGGLATPGVVLHVQLRRDGEIRGRATATPGSDGSWQATFRQGGQPVKVKAGDRITGDLAPDASLVVRAISIDADPGTDSATGHCYPDGPFGVRFFRPDGSELVGARQFGDADGNGDFSLADLAFLAAGQSMRLSCANAAGDTVKRTAPV